jgi:glycosyltransferase involved in cell wall biosynthesis
MRGATGVSSKPQRRLPLGCRQSSDKEIPIRVAVVHSFYSSDVPSGENQAVEAHVDALRRAGYDAELFAVRTDDVRRERLYPLRAGIRVATGRGPSPLRAMAAFRPDVVHVHNLFPNLGRRWVEHLRTPLVATLRNYRLLCANGLLYRDNQPCTLCADGRVWSGTRYGCYRGSRIATLPLSWANRRGPAADPVVRRADRVMVLSEDQAAVFAFAGVDEARMRVVPNFVPDALVPEAPTSGRSGWLFAGRLTAEKGAEELVEHWPSGYPLAVAGDGPLRARLESRAAGKPIRFLGAIERSAVVREMTEREGVVIASRCLEVAPLVYCEALAAGATVFALEGTSVANAVRRERTGAVLRSLDELPHAFTSVRCDPAHNRGVFDRTYSEAAFVHTIGDLYGDIAGDAG